MKNVIRQTQHTPLLSVLNKIQWSSAEDKQKIETLLSKGLLLEEVITELISNKHSNRSVYIKKLLDLYDLLVQVDDLKDQLPMLLACDQKTYDDLHILLTRGPGGYHYGNTLTEQEFKKLLDTLPDKFWRSISLDYRFIVQCCSRGSDAEQTFFQKLGQEFLAKFGIKILEDMDLELWDELYMLRYFTEDQQRTRLALLFAEAMEIAVTDVPQAVITKLITDYRNNSDSYIRKIRMIFDRSPACCKKRQWVRTPDILKDFLSVILELEEYILTNLLYIFDKDDNASALPETKLQELLQALPADLWRRIKEADYSVGFYPSPKQTQKERLLEWLHSLPEETAKFTL